MKIELKNVTKTYDLFTKGIEDVTFTAEGMLGVVGEAGAGLHTLAGVIGGVLDTDSGELLFGGKLMNDVPPEKRNAFYSDRMTPPLKGSV
ncbi:MAG TPA: ABC transporter ATP-binding protein, partial [Firmicutes bacterium]|nr:ABC transporter ATP-binding protein [Bacillota bacterium]